MKQYLSFSHVSKSFNNNNQIIKVLDDISFLLNENEIIAIIGPSGCGKSTILNLISSLIKEDEGEIKIDSKIGYMFQQDYLFSWRNVLDNITLGLELTKNKTKENMEYLNSLLAKYQLEEFKYYYPQELSGGMKKRVSLIRTLLLKPDVLLLDEPFSGLDYQTKLIVMNDIYKIIKNEKKSAIIVTHDINEAISFASRIIILTCRPSKIKKEIPINIDIEDKTPLKVYSSSYLSTYFNLIYKELELDETSTKKES